MALRANDTPTAKHVSENLGQVEQVEANEGMSYGVNDMRDGVNLSRMQVTRPLVMHTEVTNLPNLSGFLRFGRNLPVVHFQDRFNTVATIADAFVERDTPPVRDRDGEALIAAIHAEAKSTESPSPPRRKKAARPVPPPPPPTSPDLFEGGSSGAAEGEGVEPKPAENPPTDPVAPAPAFTLAPQRGRTRIELDVYDRENGPARPARPA
ncbi:type IV secretion system DNA-binding domain-containing protein [Sphingomonadaceae bacterium jetA1]